MKKKIELFFLKFKFPTIYLWEKKKKKPEKTETPQNLKRETICLPLSYPSNKIIFLDTQV